MKRTLRIQDKERMNALLISISLALVVAFFIDQYFIYGKEWRFLLELVI